MKPYREFNPTGFDGTGAFLPDQQDWLVAPVGINRDSGLLDQSNWSQMVQELENTEEEGENWEIHRFGHWACGWFEILIVKPEARASTVGEVMETRLEDYPVLDEDDYCEREHEAYLEAWSMWGAAEFRSQLGDDYTDDSSDDELMELYEDGIPSGEFYIPEGDGVSLNIEQSIQNQCT